MLYTTNQCLFMIHGTSSLLDDHGGDGYGDDYNIGEKCGCSEFGKWFDLVQESQTFLHSTALSQSWVVLKSSLWSVGS